MKAKRRRKALRHDATLPGFALVFAGRAGSFVRARPFGAFGPAKARKKDYCVNFPPAGCMVSSESLGQQQAKISKHT
jgi:hypothetical protein